MLLLKVGKITWNTKLLGTASLQKCTEWWLEFSRPGLLL